MLVLLNQDVPSFGKQYRSRSGSNVLHYPSDSIVINETLELNKVGIRQGNRIWIDSAGLGLTLVLLNPDLPFFFGKH